MDSGPKIISYFGDTIVLFKSHRNCKRRNKDFNLIISILSLFTISQWIKQYFPRERLE